MGGGQWKGHSSPMATQDSGPIQPMDPMGCMMPETCVAEGDECPFYCPWNPPMECGEGNMPCPGPMDAMGCMGPESCVAIGDECPFYCPPMYPMDCGEGMTSCPGGMDPMGCLMPEMCMPEGEPC